MAKLIDASVRVVERDVTNAELDRMRAGFEEHQAEFGVALKEQKRLGFVALSGDTFIGCASGLIDYNWFFLTDLWVEKRYRKIGLGALLLKILEAKVMEFGIGRIWTWTKGFEAPRFYKRQGYEVFCELENYYPPDHARVGLSKNLAD